MSSLYLQITCQVRPLVYHFAWGPMRAKPVLVGPVAGRLEQLLREKAAAMEVRLRAVEIRPALVYLAVEAPPSLAPHTIVCGLKAHSSGVLRREFKELTTIPTLWTREYLVAAGEDVRADDLLAALLATLPPCRPRGRPRCGQS
jgi:REP-associated tyrosine transposase